MTKEWLALACIPSLLACPSDVHSAFHRHEQTNTRLERAPTTPTSPVDPVGPTDALDAVPWPARIGLERAMAEVDPRHAPTTDHGHPQLASYGVSASFAEATELHVGRHTATLRAVSLGRANARTPLATVAPTIEGCEVRAERAPGVVEWWRSLPSGLEHGMTIANRPAGAGELVLEIEVTGLAVRSAAHDAVDLVDEGGVAVATYAHLVVTDATGVALPAVMLAGRGEITLVLDDAGAAYPVAIDPLVTSEEATLIATDGAMNDYFGHSVALTADGSRALVGAYQDITPGGVWTGSARVFVRSGTSWAEEAILLPSDRATGDHFGWSVSMSSDGTRAVVGAPLDDTAGGADAGSARVFVRSGVVWTEEATLVAGDGQRWDNLGSSVSLSGDGSRALVGANNDDHPTGREDVGSARVFVRSGPSWAEEATLLAERGLGGDDFGSSVSLAGDGSRALVGAPRDDTASGIDAGSARVFVRSGASWAEETMLLAADGASGEFFGCSVSLTVDASRALIGAFGDDAAGGADAGSARVFVRSGASWAEEATLLAADGTRDDLFGWSVSLSADGSRALVAARDDDTAGATHRGSARVFLRSGASWAEEGALRVASGLARDFGWSISMSADGTRALVGAPLDAGSVRVFTLLLAPPGMACTSGATCGTGLCVDGVCCTSACGAGALDCQACSVASGGSIDGTCTALSAAAAPMVTCRAPAGPCDAAELCSPTSSACPADGRIAAGTECRAPAGPCDLREVCDGASSSCPPDALAPSGAYCRAPAGPCDMAEGCTGSSADCPADGFLSPGTECRPPAGPCDVREVCTGTAVACPLDLLAPPTSLCRAIAGPCDAPDYCSGMSVACPDALLTGTVCRAPAGPCDVEDRCDGVSQLCPDAFAPPTRECGDAPSGACDAQDHCTGTSADCRPTFLAGVECRASSGGCDPAEICGGAAADCPPDQISPAGTVCRASSDGCDPAESCDGTAASCPADENACTSHPDAGPSDAGVGRDGGIAPMPVEACRCRVMPRAPAPTSAGIVLLLACWVAAQRRRR